MENPTGEGVAYHSLPRLNLTVTVYLPNMLPFQPPARRHDRRHRSFENTLKIPNPL